ncbi:MAG: hypothetical protein WBZ08_04665, partial [Pseudolabrys sp.]
MLLDEDWLAYKNQQANLEASRESHAIPSGEDIGPKTLDQTLRTISGASRRFYIASGASEEIVWADDFSLPSPANARRDARG